jgi:PAS domain S-box-containing protein
MNLLPDVFKDKFAKQQYDLVKSLVETMSEAVMITDAAEHTYDPPILYVNSAFTELTGYQPEEVIGKTPKILQGPDTEHAELERLKRQLDEKKKFIGRTWNYRKDGSKFMMEWEIVTFHNAHEVPGFYMTIQREAAA